MHLKIQTYQVTDRFKKCFIECAWEICFLKWHDSAFKVILILVVKYFTYERSCLIIIMIMIIMIILLLLFESCSLQIFMIKYTPS